MNLELEREKVVSNAFSPLKIIITSIFGGLGILILYYSGVFDIRNLYMLRNCILKHLFEIITGLCFIYCALLVYTAYFLNIILPPKKEIVLLNNDKDGDKIFTNKKGKKIRYFGEVKNLEIGYYSVLKTRNFVYEILDEVTVELISKNKKSY